MGVGPATWKKNRIEEEVERETAVRFRTLVVRNSILVLGLWPSCRVTIPFSKIGPDPDLLEALERARSGALPSVPAARRQHTGKRSSIVAILVGRDHDGSHELSQ